MQNSAPSPSGTTHFEWVDIVRGMAILWIVYFHCFIAYGGRYPWLLGFENFGGFLEQCAPGGSLLQKLPCAVEALFAALFERGSQGVGVFVLFSGFGLTYSLVKRKTVRPAWGEWYRRRLFRLFPIYWIAHLLILVSPIQYRPDPVDYRFLLSFLGDRVYPGNLFFYFVPSWWFFGLLVELYIVFPVLYRLLLRLGSAKYLALCIVVASASRYFLYAILQADGNWVQGAFFACRLWEFAAGMVLGKLLAENAEATARWLLSSKSMLLGILVYGLGVLSYQPNFLYSFTDGLSGMGLAGIMIYLAGLAGKIPGIGKALAMTGAYSYGLYLFHQPFVMYAGDRLQTYNIGIFILIASAVIGVITVVSMCSEYGINHALNRLGTKRESN
ncbi:MAG: acyltransferase [Syntrophobacter sp.]